MAVISDPNVAGQIARVGPVDTSAGDTSTHVNVRPDDYGGLGHYKGHMLTGTMVAGLSAASEIMQLRYTGTGKVIVYTINIEHFRSLGTAFAAVSTENFKFDVIKSTGWSVDGTGGGTLVPEKMRVSMATPTTTLRIATTTGLGAGTKTPTTNPYRAIRGIHNTAINSMQLGLSLAAANIVVGYPGSAALLPAFGDWPTGSHPVVLANNEGLSVRATVNATGTWEAAITVTFAEVPNY